MVTCVCKHPVVYGGVLRGANVAFTIRDEDAEEMSMIGLVERDETMEDAPVEMQEVAKPRRGRPPKN